MIADTGDSLIQVVAGTTGTFYGQAMTAGDIYTVAGNGTDGFSGDGGPATSAELGLPEATVTDAAGDVLISDTGSSRIRRWPAEARARGSASARPGPGPGRAGAA